MVIYTALQRIIFSLYANTDLPTDGRTDKLLAASYCA